MIDVRQVDYRDGIDRQAFLEVLDAYSRDPMGAGHPLAEDVRARLCDDLSQIPSAVSFLAWADDVPVGLINGFFGYSTFKALPLMNVHDIAVMPQWRGQGVGKLLLQALQDHACQQGCCKLTLEVLSGNQRARQAYLAFGFEDYALDPEVGTAMFMQKWL
jgi:ribosomal protein S18 acetylase RimI-like enzyme